MIPIFKPYLYQEAKDLAKQAIDNEDIAQGPNIELFENRFSSYCNRKYGVTCSNGTVALYLAVKALNLPKGSEVILPSMTILSCLTSIVENDLNAVFCDIDPITYNIAITNAIAIKPTIKFITIIMVFLFKFIIQIYG